MAMLKTGYWATLGKSRQVRYVPVLEYRLLAARLCKSRQVGCVAILKYKRLAARLGQFR